jgi:hypothetical protein
MKRKHVDSSAIASVGYDPKKQILEIEFVHGAIYQYFEVPAAEYRSLMKAASIGGYVNAHIKDEYRYIQIR